MDAKICDRCGKFCEEKDSTQIRVGFGQYEYFDLCKDCRLWLLHELGKKEKWEEKYESDNM